MKIKYPTGGRGNVYIGAGFAHSRHATFNIESATFNTEVMAIQNGTEIATGSTTITYYDTITSTDGSTWTTKFKAQGAAGSEIGFIYILNEDGTYGDVYTQVAEIGASAAKEFKYEPTTKTITFNTVATSEAPVQGDTIVCAYQFKTADNAQKIELDAGSTPSTALVSAYGIARDICTGELFPCVIEGTAQIDGNWNFDLSADGDPVVQNLTMEFVKSCTSSNLYTFTIYTEDEAGD